MASGQTYSESTFLWSHTINIKAMQTNDKMKVWSVTFGFGRDSTEISLRQPQKANKGPANLAVDHNNGENSFFSEFLKAMKWNCSVKATIKHVFWVQLYATGGDWDVTSKWRDLFKIVIFLQ